VDKHVFFQVTLPLQNLAGKEMGVKGKRRGREDFAIIILQGKKGKVGSVVSLK